MDPHDYQHLADTCLEHVASWLEAFDPDEVDYSTSDGVLTLEFPDRVRFVLNRQAGAQQMWFAAGARAWHYDWEAQRGTWLDDRDGHELCARIAKAVSEKIGRTVELASA